jgi:hypothetical protein
LLGGGFSAEHAEEIYLLNGSPCIPDQQAQQMATSDYSIFGIAVDRSHALKWLFPQEKVTFHGSQKVYAYSENALERNQESYTHRW